jgi:hypothetical protein
VKVTAGGVMSPARRKEKRAALQPHDARREGTVAGCRAAHGRHTCTVAISTPRAAPPTQETAMARMRPYSPLRDPLLLTLGGSATIGVMALLARAVAAMLGR